MKPPIFDYRVPDNLEDALAQLSQAGGEAKLLAGGQSLVPMMNYRLVQPAVLIDLNPLSGLDFVAQVDGGGTRLGALTRLSRLEREAEALRSVPLLAESLPHIAHHQIRTRSTIGGSLAHADPAAELPVVALAVGARMKLIRSGSERWLEAPDFFLGMFTTALGEDEILVEVEIPPSPPRTGWAFLEFARREGDYALAGLAVRLTVDKDLVCREARLVFLNAGDGPIVAEQAAARLVGEAYSDEAGSDAARIAAETEIEPFGNVHASPAYQRHLARTLAHTAIGLAYRRAAAP